MGATLSMAAAGCYYLASIIICCIPHSEPLCHLSRRRTTRLSKDNEGITTTSNFDNEQSGNTHDHEQQQDEQQWRSQRAKQGLQVTPSFTSSKSSRPHIYEDEPEDDDIYDDDAEISFGHGGRYDSDSFQNNSASHSRSFD
jgi:hypothetical protein